MDKAAKAETLADFVASLPGGAQPPANKPADLAAASAGLPASAVGWAVTLGRRCSDAVLTAMGQDAVWLPEDETRRGIEFSVVSAVRRLTADVREFPLSPDQVSLAHKMARHGLPYERFMLGLRMVQEILLEALLDEAARYRPASGRDGRWLPGALALATSKFLDESAAAMVSEYLAESQRVIARTVASRAIRSRRCSPASTCPMTWPLASLASTSVTTTWRSSCGTGTEPATGCARRTRGGREQGGRRAAGRRSRRHP